MSTVDGDIDNALDFAGGRLVDIPSAFLARIELLVGSLRKFGVHRSASSRRYRELFAAAPDGMVETDSSGSIVEANPKAGSMLGVDPDRLPGQSLVAFVSPADRPAFWLSLGSPPSPEPLAVTLNPSRGAAFPATLTAAVVHNEDGGRLVWDIRDATADQRRLRELTHRAEHDPLTGVANRASFLRRLDEAISSPAPGPAVLFVDLDGFKAVNDGHGHHIGDQLLSLVGQRIRNAERASDMSARIGGDEFAVVLPDVADANEAMALAERVRTALAQPFALPAVGGEPARTVTITATVGVAVAAGDVTPEDLLRQADGAMYAAKRGGGDRAVLAGAEPTPEPGGRRRVALAGGLLRRDH